MTSPTARQQEAWDVATRLGSQSAAGKVLDMGQGQLRAHLVGYAKALGISLDQLPGATGTGRAREHALYPLIDRILQCQEEIDASLSALDAKLDRLLARPVTIAAQPINHRRIADGGPGARRERKLARTG